jgi:hypothetical protein
MDQFRSRLDRCARDRWHHPDCLMPVRGKGSISTATAYRIEKDSRLPSQKSATFKPNTDMTFAGLKSKSKSHTGVGILWTALKSRDVVQVCPLPPTMEN